MIFFPLQNKHYFSELHFFLGLNFIFKKLPRNSYILIIILISVAVRLDYLLLFCSFENCKFPFILQKKNILRFNFCKLLLLLLQKKKILQFIIIAYLHVKYCKTDKKCPRKKNVEN